MLAVILNQHLIKKERAVKMQKQRIPPNPTTKQRILFLRRMGYPALKKMNTAAADVLKAMMDGNENLTRKYINILQRAGY